MVQNTGGRGLLLLLGRLGAPGLCRVGGDGPGLPELLRAGNVTGGAVVLHHPGGKVPFSRGLQHGEVFHGAALQGWFSPPIISFWRGDARGGYAGGGGEIRRTGLILFTAPQFLRHGQCRNDLLNPSIRVTVQAVRGMKNAPRPSREPISSKKRGAFLTTVSATEWCGVYGDSTFKE